MFTERIRRSVCSVVMDLKKRRSRRVLVIILLLKAGAEAHHIIPRQFADLLKVSQGSILSDESR